MKEKKPAGQRSPLSRYAYYSGIGFQMIAIIGVFTYIGHRIDQVQQQNPPLWTAGLSLLGVCLSIYTVIRAVTKKR